MDQVIENLTKRNPWTNVYGLSRSFIALGTLVTLTFNDISSLIIQYDDPLYSSSLFNSFQKFGLFEILGYENLLISKIISIIILLFVLSGYQPRVSGILHWWVSFSFFITSPVIDGGDQLTTILTLLLIPVTLLDPRKSHWTALTYKVNNEDTKRLIANFFLFIIKIQVCIVYFQSAFAKFSVEEWSNGTAIYYWFTNNTFGINRFLEPVILPIITSNFGVSILTWAVLLFEVLLFCVIFMDRKVHKYFFIMAVAFHFGILIVHGLMSFFFAISAGLILYLWPIDKAFKFDEIFAKVLKLKTKPITVI